jgi:hypothetical protein
VKTFNTVCAQGDIYIRKVDALPSTAVRCDDPENGRVIVTHSETGHHHVMDASCVTMHRLPDDIMKCLLVVSEPATLDHLRPVDRHDPILFQPGVYEVIRQREYVPEGFRRVED